MRAATPNDIVSLLQGGAVASPYIENTFGLSQSTASRHLRHLINEQRAVRIGTTKGARYGLRRNIAGIGSTWPLHRVEANGHIEELGTLYALAANEYYFEPMHPKRFAWAGLSSGLPYFLQDQRPGGFLGRAVPQLYPELHLPQRVIDFTDEHCLRYLTQRGSEAVGDLILGDAALNQYLLLQRARAPIPLDKREQEYPTLATAAMEHGLPGSSAHGENPKFTAVLLQPSGPQHVLVKFSPPIATPAGRRWSDLLIAEHLAHQILREANIASVESNILKLADRTYLEEMRFDRNGLEGRIGVSSLLAIDTALYGALDHWIASAARLHQHRRIEASTLETIRLVSTFGGLIANTDRHFGNLAFFDRYDGSFTLAPIYDMLPMLFAPQHDQIVPRAFDPPVPTTDTLRTYGRARLLAENYWSRVSQDPRISEEFRIIAAACGRTLESLPAIGAYAKPDSTVVDASPIG